MTLEVYTWLTQRSHRAPSRDSLHPTQNPVIRLSYALMASKGERDLRYREYL